MQISCWRKEDKIEPKREEEESKKMCKSAGKVKTWKKKRDLYPSRFCKNSNEIRNSDIYQQIDEWISMGTTRISSKIWQTKMVFHSAHIAGRYGFLLLATDDWRVALRFMLSSISLKPHWFSVGVIGAEVMLGSKQLETNPLFLMRRRDERVANYSVLLSPKHNSVLLRARVINLLQLWLPVLFMLEDIKDRFGGFN